MKYVLPYHLHSLTTFDFLSVIISPDIIHFQQNTLKPLQLKCEMRMIIIAIQVTESSEALLKDANCSKSKEHLRFGLRTLELVRTEDISTLLDTIISVRENSFIYQ